jgi:hypothetical protein
MGTLEIGKIQVEASFLGTWFVLVVFLKERVGRIKHDPSIFIEIQMIQEQAFGPALVEIGRGLFEEWIDREFQIEFLELNGVKVLDQSCFCALSSLPCLLLALFFRVAAFFVSLIGFLCAFRFYAVNAGCLGRVRESDRPLRSFPVSEATESTREV